MYENKINGKLSSDYGIGKSIEIISLFAYLSCDKKITARHLIITSTSGVINWYNELIFTGELNDKYNTCIVSYDMLLKYSLQFKQIA